MMAGLSTSEFHPGSIDLSSSEISVLPEIEEFLAVFWGAANF